MILNVQRQPGANLIQVADHVKALLKQLESSLPQGIKIEVLSDRTDTVRASVDDVQFTLILTIVLVVAVIYLFLRSVRATIIPGVAVPLSLVATFGVMALLGYSLNNLTLMALTISTGFVVDDAIVMIENIARYIEHGEKPLDAALKGAKQIGFTIISLTVSLVAVLIPLLFMGGVIGRLFREFAVTLSTAIVASALISLTLTAMMCAHILKPVHPGEESAIARGAERVFAWMVRVYDRGLIWVLRAPAHDDDRDDRDGGGHGRAGGRHAQGPVPAAGHRSAPRRHRGRRPTSRSPRCPTGSARSPTWCNTTRTSSRSRHSSAPTAPTPRSTAGACRSA